MRGSARYETFECLSCGAEIRILFWRFEDPNDDRNSKYPRECPASCLNPHMTYKPDPLRTSRVAQVRAEQRAVVYEFPDGTYAAPSSNDPSSSEAQMHIRDGGVRREFHSVRELNDFVRERNGGDAYAIPGRNEVIDFDNATIRSQSRDTIDVEHRKVRDERLRYAFEKIGGRATRYDQLLRDRRR